MRPSTDIGLEWLLTTLFDASLKTLMSRICGSFFTISSRCVCVGTRSRAKSVEQWPCTLATRGPGAKIQAKIWP